MINSVSAIVSYPANWDTIISSRTKTPCAGQPSPFRHELAYIKSNTTLRHKSLELNLFTPIESDDDLKSALADDSY